MTAAYIHTDYTLIGYEVRRDQEEIGRGGNHRMCSESRLLPSDGPWEVNDHRMTLAEIKTAALLAHKQALKDNPDAVDAGCCKDVDGNNEELAMLDISQGMTKHFKAAYKHAERMREIRLRIAQGWYNMLAH